MANNIINTTDNKNKRLGALIMKFTCNLKGEVNSDQCFFCFKTNSKGFASRVLCKKVNAKNTKRNNERK